MPRAHRYITAGRIYHLTHRCHDRAFLLRFAKDRDTYRSMLRERSAMHRVYLLNYCISCNHIHLLVTAEAKDRISRLMHSLEGDFAQAYNLRKSRTGAFWGDRYHATLVDGGEHLWNCLKYIDLNMVRAGEVRHPEAWNWCGYGELVGKKKRYRLIDDERLLSALGNGVTKAEFREVYASMVQKAILQKELEREAMWTESLAVGSRTFVESVETTLKNNRRREINRNGVGGAWFVREEPDEYGA